MSFRQHYEVICDGCSENGPISACKIVAEDRAKDEGWQIEREYPNHLCPTCRAIEADKRVWNTDAYK